MCDDDVMVDNFNSLQKNFYHANKDWTRYKDKLCKYHEWTICKTEKKHNPSHDWFGNFEHFIAGLEKTLQLQLLSAERNFEHDIPGLEKNLLSAERNFENDIPGLEKNLQLQLLSAERELLGRRETGPSVVSLFAVTDTMQIFLKSVKT